MRQSDATFAARGAVVVGERCVLKGRYEISTQLVLPIVWEAILPAPTPHHFPVPPISRYPPLLVHRTQCSTHDRHVMELLLQTRWPMNRPCDRLTTPDVEPLLASLAIALNVLYWIIKGSAAAVESHILSMEQISKGMKLEQKVHTDKTACPCGKVTRNREKKVTDRIGVPLKSLSLNTGMLMRALRW